MGNARRQRWSYKTGEKGKNRVRVFEHPRDEGVFYVEWHRIVNVTEAESGVATKRKRYREKLPPEDQSRARAVAHAEELAEELLTEREQSSAPSVSVAGLIDHYLREKTPQKTKGKQGHDRRARRIWFVFFDTRQDPARRRDRHPRSLDRIDFESFAESRKYGQLRGWNPVGNRQVAYDLKFLIAVLNWGTGARPDGSQETYLPGGNPWGASIRRSQGWKMPRTATPHRPSMTPELRQGLVSHSPNWRFQLALVLQRDTRRRNSAIRCLDWGDIDQREWTIRWRGETDKAGRDSVTPILSEEVKEALRKAPSRGLAGPVFPSTSDPSRATPWGTFQTWLQRAKKNWIDATPEAERSVLKDRLRGVGYHAEKRAGVRDAKFRSLPPKVQQEISGTRYETLRDVYDEVTPTEIRNAWAALDAERASTDTNELTPRGEAQ